MTAAPLIDISGVSKDYHALRPLRIARLTLQPGEQTAILGIDGAAAEVLVNLLTGATLPDRGEVRVFGRTTSAIRDADEWLSTVDCFGIVTERAVLLDQLTVIQNLAIPFSLEVEPPTDEIRQRAETIAREVGLPHASWSARVAETDSVDRLRLRVGRALAANPKVLLLDHVSVGLDRASVTLAANNIRKIASRRGVAILAATADEEFARAVATRVLALDAATGRLTDARRGRWW